MSDSFGLSAAMIGQLVNLCAAINAGKSQAVASRHQKGGMLQTYLHFVGQGCLQRRAQCCLARA